MTSISEKNVLVPSELMLFDNKPVLKGYVKTINLTIQPKDGW